MAGRLELLNNEVYIAAGSNNKIDIGIAGTSEINLGADTKLGAKVVSNVGALSYKTIAAATASAGAITLAWSTSKYLRTTLNQNITAITFTAPVGPAELVWIITQAAALYTVTGYPATVKWPGGVAPVITATSAKVDILKFIYNGTDYYGSFNQNY